MLFHEEDLVMTVFLIRQICLRTYTQSIKRLMRLIEEGEYCGRIGKLHMGDTQFFLPIAGVVGIRLRITELTGSVCA